MSSLKKVSGKIINHNEIFFGSISFDNKFQKIDRVKNSNINQYIIPGFVDLHCHGAINNDTMQGFKSIKKMSEFHLSKGTTTLLPTTLTNKFEDTFKALEGFNKFFLHEDSNVVGVHLEGPFINPNKLGAQPSLTQPPNTDFIKKIHKIAKIKTVTLAPEIKGAEKLIKYLFENKINIQFGHSLANYDCCKKLMSKYSVSFTHLYNAMSGNDHRNPGMLTAAMELSHYAEIICDLYHVSEPSIKIAKKCIPKLYAITDSIGATGMPDGLYKYGNFFLERKGDKATLQNSNTLAGSIMDMHTTFLNLKKLGFSMQELVALTSYNAAQYLNEKNIGSIQINYKANFLVLDQKLNLKEIYLNGKKINE